MSDWRARSTAAASPHQRSAWEATLFSLPRGSMGVCCLQHQRSNTRQQRLFQVSALTCELVSFPSGRETAIGWNERARAHCTASLLLCMLLTWSNRLCMRACGKRVGRAERQIPSFFSMRCDCPRCGAVDSACARLTAGWDADCCAWSPLVPLCHL